MKLTTTLKPTLGTMAIVFAPVFGVADKTWVLSFRGPWNKTWKEWLPKEGKEITLTNGREIVE